MGSELRELQPSEKTVFQATAISRAAYDLSTNAKRLLYAAASCLRLTDTEIPTITMALADVIKALGLSRDGRTYERLESAVDGLMGKVITVPDGKGGWEKYTWITYSKLNAETGQISFRFHEEVKPFLFGLRNSFSVFLLRDLGKLQGKYALRIFELVIANQGFAGAGGNNPGEWFTDLLFADLREMFLIGPSEYKLTSNFRRKVVDDPVREINEADIGVRLECDYDTHRRGRTLRGVRILARMVAKDEPRPVSPATAAEREEADLKAAYPERFTELLREAEAQPSFSGFPRLDPETEALRQLAAEVAAKPKRGRPRKTKGE